VKVLCEAIDYVELLLQMRLFQAIQHKSLNIILSARYARILSYRGFSIENKERKRNIAKISLTMVGILCEEINDNLLILFAKGLELHIIYSFT